jgi:pyridoxal phosphate enzyme (YggS family)
LWHGFLSGTKVDQVEAILRRNLDAVEARLAAACRRSGRRREDVTLIAVTKTVSVEVAARLPALGVCNLGESRPQELWRKAALLPLTVNWHLIGHLQRNKVPRTLPLVRWVHSVDSLRLLAALEEEAGHQKRLLDILLEVNMTHDPARHGFAPEEVPALVPHLLSLRHLQARGLMTMAAYEDNPEDCRSTFAGLHGLRDRLRTEMGSQAPLGDLSMGMSNDFEIAVEEGATLVRLGTVLFEGLEDVS